MCGYCFVFCCSRSFALSGTWKAGPLRRGMRAGCEGGLKRVGFSRRRALLGFDVLACRSARSGRGTSRRRGLRMATCRDSWRADMLSKWYVMLQWRARLTRDAGRKCNHENSAKTSSLDAAKSFTSDMCIIVETLEHHTRPLKLLRSLSLESIEKPSEVFNYSDLIQVLIS